MQIVSSQLGVAFEAQILTLPSGRVLQHRQVVGVLEDLDASAQMVGEFVGGGGGCVWRGG